MDAALATALSPTTGQGAEASHTLTDAQYKKARKTAQDFEAFFVSMYLETMFSGIKTDGPFGGGHAEGVYRSMLNQEFGKAIAKSGGLGIADQVMNEIIKLQEAQ